MKETEERVIIGDQRENERDNNRRLERNERGKYDDEKERELRKRMRKKIKWK